MMKDQMKSLEGDFELEDFLEEVGFYDEADIRLDEMDKFLKSGKPITYENVIEVGKRAQERIDASKSKI